MTKMRQHLTRDKRGAKGEVKENDCNCVGRGASTRQINELEWELRTRRTVGFPLLLLQEGKYFILLYFFKFNLHIIFRAPVRPLPQRGEGQRGYDSSLVLGRDKTCR